VIVLYFVRDVNKKNKKSLQIKRVIYITRNGIDLMQNKNFPDNEKIKKGQSGYTKWLNMVLILADDN
jgi:hypothetical protein